MFTGIVEKTSRVRSVKKLNGGIELRIENPPAWKVVRGASISVDGICLTSVGSGNDMLTFQLVEETLEKTSAKTLRVGSIVNLERPIKAGGEFGGHFVQGHVDTSALVIAHTDKTLTIELPRYLKPYIVNKGSVAINGVSLTISKKDAKTFSVALIPHTKKHTNLGALRKGDMVNVEADMFAKYAIAAMRSSR